MAVIPDTASDSREEYFQTMESRGSLRTRDTKAVFVPPLAHLRSFCLPGGEEHARLIRGIRTTQVGELRMSPEARWIPFTAEEFVDATRSSFRWQARLDPGKVGSPTVVDAYEEGHGWLVVKIGGIVPLKKASGPDADKGELQRYLSSITFCPPILLNHPSLECVAIGPRTLRVRDGRDRTGAIVDIDLSEEGCPLGCHATRPRLIGRQAILTPWSATCGGFREWEGLRIPTHLEVHWLLRNGAFTYFRADITSLIAVQ